MANIAQDLFPDARIVAQAAIYCVSLVVSQKLIVGPLLKLHAERQKRTHGSVENAKIQEQKASELMERYQMELQGAHKAAMDQRAKVITGARVEADALVAAAQQKAHQLVKNAESELAGEWVAEHARVKTLSQELAQQILVRLKTLPVLLVMVLPFASQAFASESAHHSPGVDVWFGIFWPYFQFACYLGAMIFLGRKPIEALLESRRDKLRTKLSEAHEAAELAQRRLKEYETKIAQLESEIRVLHAEAVQQAGTEKNRILNEATRYAHQIESDVSRRIEQLVAEAKRRLRVELAQETIAQFLSALSSSDAAIIDEKLKNQMLGSLEQFQRSRS